MDDAVALQAHTESVQLRPEVLAKCARKARMEGMSAGVTSGFVGGVIGMRALRFDRNKTLLCGILTGVLSGYFFTQAFLGTHIAEETARETLLRRAAASPVFAQDDPTSSNART